MKIIIWMLLENFKKLSWYVVFIPISAQPWISAQPRISVNPPPPNQTQISAHPHPTHLSE